MEYVTLGRTGLTVSVAGLGCGGFSRLGLSTGKSKAEAVALVRQALDLGVNLLDTADSASDGSVIFNCHSRALSLPIIQSDELVDAAMAAPAKLRR